MRDRYRKAYGLTSAEMDNEPLEDIIISTSIWGFEAIRERKQQREQERKQQVADRQNGN